MYANRGGFSLGEPGSYIFFIFVSFEAKAQMRNWIRPVAALRSLRYRPCMETRSQAREFPFPSYGWLEEKALFCFPSKSTQAGRLKRSAVIPSEIWPPPHHASSCLSGHACPWHGIRPPFNIRVVAIFKVNGHRVTMHSEAKFQLCCCKVYFQRVVTESLYSPPNPGTSQ